MKSRIKAKILVITRHYLDEQLGGPNCSKAIVRALAEIYEDCSLIYPEHNDHETDLYFLRHTDIRLLPCRDRRSRLKKCLDMYCGRIHRFSNFAKKEICKRGYDIVFIDHSFTAASGILETALKNAGKVITLHHNVEKEYIRDNQQNILFRLPYNYFALKAERNAVKKCALNLVLTDDDARHFSLLFPSAAASFRTVGTFLYEDSAQTALSEDESRTFVISGSLGAPQTEVSIFAFLNDLLSILNKVCPDNRLRIVGRNASKRIVELCAKNRNVELIQNAPDYFGEIRKGCYYLAPIHTGGGQKLRIMDGLRAGMPVLAHKKAVRGYESIVKDKAMFSYDDAASFESALRQLLSTQISHEQVAETFFSHFSFEAGKKRLEQILKENK